ncbi:MAG: hypothetical protein NTV52_27080 [Acidobacteria bacterium]|nr:hypothetical protein [Acidobacteriota bacterium]
MTDTIELTLQNVPRELAEALAKESELRHATLDETVIAILREQLTPAVPFSNGLAAKYGGTWTEEEFQEFERNTEDFRRIDPEMWK